MNKETLLQQLEELAGSDYFDYDSEPIMAQLADLGAGMDIVEDLLRMMERHPMADFGMPGAMVHFIEEFSPDYIPLLIASVKRRPTMYNVWMLNRCKNGGDKSADFLALLQEIAGNEALEPEIRETAQDFVNYHLMG